MTDTAPNAISGDEAIVKVENLNFSYPHRDSLQRPLSLRDVNLSIPRGARVVVMGANGSGKSTLLRIIGGRHFISKEACTVYDRSSFHDTTLLAEMVYLGDWWRRDYIGIPVKEVLAVHLANPRCRDRVLYLSALFEVSLDWPVSMLSDGERRRVQIVAGLAEPKSLYLLDEITAELDLLSRVNLLRFLRGESEQRGATVMLATHIFDDIGFLAPTHVLRTVAGRATVYDTSLLASAVGKGRSETTAIIDGWRGDTSAGAEEVVVTGGTGDDEMTPGGSDAVTAIAVSGACTFANVAASRSFWFSLARKWLSEDVTEVRAAYAMLPWQLRDCDLKIK